MDKRIFLTKSELPSILILAFFFTSVFAGMCFFEHKNVAGMILACISAGLLVSAIAYRNHKASLENDVLRIAAKDGEKWNLSLNGIRSWEIVSDSNMDGKTKNSRDNPAIALNFGDGAEVVMRCYFDRHLHRELIRYCMTRKRHCCLGDPQLYAYRYRPYEKEIRTLLDPDVRPDFTESGADTGMNTL